MCVNNTNKLKSSTDYIFKYGDKVRLTDIFDKEGKPIEGIVIGFNYIKVYVRLIKPDGKFVDMHVYPENITKY